MVGQYQQCPVLFLQPAAGLFWQLWYSYCQRFVMVMVQAVIQLVNMLSKKSIKVCQSASVEDFLSLTSSES